jgi:hypothetical protein
MRSLKPKDRLYNGKNSIIGHERGKAGFVVSNEFTFQGKFIHLFLYYMLSIYHSVQKQIDSSMNMWTVLRKLTLYSVENNNMTLPTIQHIQNNAYIVNMVILQ